MTVTKTLNVDASALYATFVDALQQEIAFCTKKTITPYQGLEYEKDFTTKLGTKCRAQVRVDKLVPGQCYRLVITNQDDVNIVEYRLMADGAQTVVTYVEEFSSKSHKRKANHQLMEFILTFYTKHKAKKKLKGIEKYINAQRKG